MVAPILPTAILTFKNRKKKKIELRQHFGAFSLLASVLGLLTAFSIIFLILSAYAAKFLAMRICPQEEY